MLERHLRLASGLALFAYITTHFLSHATGLWGAAAMDRWGIGVLLAPWRTNLGHALVFGSLFTHIGLGLRALWRRRHLRIPPAEAFQLAFGIVIPFLLIPHAVNVRLGALLYGLPDDYNRILYQYWILPPAIGLVRQFAVLTLAWIHGCLGIHFFLRRQGWYGRWAPRLLLLATLPPFFAVLGLVNGGWGLSIAQLEGPPSFASDHTPASSVRTAIAMLSSNLQNAWITLVAAILVLRAVRSRRARARAIRIAYPEGRTVRVPSGFSVLEASRWFRIPHAAACGGRGRCSTCRVRVDEGLEALSPPKSGERATLERIAAPPVIRLACQLRPLADLAVVPLLPAELSVLKGFGLPLGEASEREVTALSIDLRGSTRLAAGRPPYDTLFVVDRYVRRVTASVERHSGIVTSVAGDGVMCLFGARGSAEAGARAALDAAWAIWCELDRLSVALEPEFGHRLAFGIGIHSGPAVVGAILVQGRPSAQFLGDTGNVAARLEAVTRDHCCTLIVSEPTLRAARLEPDGAIRRVELRLHGREDLPIRAALFENSGQFARLVTPATSALAPNT